MAELNDYEIEKIAGGAPMAVTDETEEDLFARGCKAHIPIDGGDCPAYKCVLDGDLYVKYCCLCAKGIVRNADRGYIYCTEGL